MRENHAQTDEAERLFAAALECLERGDSRNALKLAKNLERLRFSGAFEIRALVHIDNGEPKRAIALLKRGVKLAPRSWRLWELLGNLLSDSARFAEAEEAYERALTCPDPDIPAIQYNCAVALARHGEYAAALDRLVYVTGSDLSTNGALLKASLLTSLKRCDEAIAMAQEVVVRIGNQAQKRENSGEELAAAYSELARAHWEGRCDATEALKTAWKALEHGRRNFLAMRIIREARALKSSGARRYSIRMKGRWFEPFEGETATPGFFRNYEVIADNPIECLDFIRELEPIAVRESLEIESVRLIEDCPREPKGLVAAESYLFWEQDDEERPRAN
jgi:tetratricopeptide (TPR) repeat protein